jgi:hypothetical protein
MLPAEVQMPLSASRIHTVDAVLWGATTFTNTCRVGLPTGDVVVAHEFRGSA